MKKKTAGSPVALTIYGFLVWKIQNKSVSPCNDVVYSWCLIEMHVPVKPFIKIVSL